MTCGRWKGAGMYGFIDEHFNPAGIPFKEGSRSIMKVSLFVSQKHTGETARTEKQ